MADQDDDDQPMPADGLAPEDDDQEQEAEEEAGEAGEETNENGGDASGPSGDSDEGPKGHNATDSTVEDGVVEEEAEMEIEDPEDAPDPGPPLTSTSNEPPVSYDYVSLTAGTTDAAPSHNGPDTSQKKKAVAPMVSKNDRYAKLESRIAADPWDTDAWIALLGEAMRKGEPSVVQDAFERFLKQFPTSARHWIAYAEFEISRGDVQKIESIFARCLRPVPDVGLWNCYLTYVRRRYGNERDAAHRATVGKAFEFVLQNVGMDKDSGGLWADYIAFLKTADAKGTYEEQQKMDILRKTYHRALAVPIANIEQLWRDYDAYEHSLSRMTAKKFISDRSSAYMLARTAQRELKIMTESLDSAQKNWLARPPTWSDKECQLLMTWKRYIEWERTNPLKLEDKAALVSRIVYAYKRALLMLRHFPELWYEASSYLNEAAKADEALSMLKQGVDAISTSALLHLSLADLYESRNQVPAAKQLYESLVENLEQKISGINARAEAEMTRVAAAVQAQYKASAALDGEEREERRQKEKAAVDKVDAARMKEVGEVREALALAWVFYMRFSRRTENIKAARAIFSRARKSKNCMPHVYVASALMEHYISKDPQVAGRIFELGLKNVPEGNNGDLLVAYISEYLDWLISQNDDNNTRALFERSLLTVPADKTRTIWSKFAAYEAEFGDLASLLRVEKRRAEAFPEDAYHLNGLVNLGQRYAYLDLKVVADKELGLPALQGLDKAMSLKPRSKSSTNITLDSKDSKPSESLEGNKGPLDSFHPERYPRPDFGRYNVHKPELVQATPRLRVEGRSPMVPDAPRQGLPPKPPTPNLTVPVSGKPVLNTPPHHPVSNVHFPPGLLPELIARLISFLPAPTQYSGPVLPADDLLSYIRSLPINPATSIPKFVPYPSTFNLAYGGTGSPGYSPTYPGEGRLKRRGDDERGGGGGKRFKD